MNVIFTLHLKLIQQKFKKRHLKREKINNISPYNFLCAKICLPSTNTIPFPLFYVYVHRNRYKSYIFIINQAE